MGLGHIPVSVSGSLIAADYDAFPSPAASLTDAGLDTPSTTHTLLSQQSPGFLKPPSSAFDDSSAAALPTEPDGHVVHAQPAVTTPTVDVPVFPSMNVIVGGALAPVHTSLSPRHQPARRKLGLQLPSFKALGIAAPHPDRFANLNLYGSELEATMDGAVAERSSQNLADADLLAAFTSTCLSPRQLRPIDPKSFIGGGRTAATPLRHDIATLTPPADTGDIRFNPIATVSSAAMDSPSTDPGMFSHSQAGESSGGAEQESTPGQETPIAPPAAGMWVDGALAEVLENLRSATPSGQPLRVLSHALPSPSQDGHVFPSIIEAIHSSTSGSPTVWINVFHAIQGRFNLADLPTSPPSTPGPAVGGEDYFTQKVFDSAVSISDYQEDLSSLPRSPRPIVPPSSINVSIVERYIPPATTHEFSDMFNPNGPSILVDRLVELSPNNGSLIFIYPTRPGAQTFMNEYLSPVLDPLLRSIVVVNGLSSNLSTAVGRMVAADQMLGFDQLQHSMGTLCAKLTQRSSSVQKFHGKRASFSLAHASREKVHIAREIWARDWWAKQEKQRIREAMTRYTQDAQKKSSNEHVDRAPTPTELIQQLLDGIIRNPYPSSQHQHGGIEVGVFVIQRSD